MFEWLTAAWGVIVYLWKFIRPIYSDIMAIVEQVKTEGLTDEAARKRAFQLITDKVQERGLEKIPDSVANSALELAYQIYLSRQK